MTDPRNASLPCMSRLSWLGQALLPWYDAQRRDLPWRDSADPYAIWLSEVILQQTRVDQGMAYWHRFLERFPDVATLAAATEDEVLKLWQGLGYYSRARNLLAAAREIAARHGGHLPGRYDELRKLPGIGPYTAAAISSIAFHEPQAAVDGNVYRVLARVFGIDAPIDQPAGQRRFAELAQQVLDPARPGDHNQAMMELGALVCLPKRPVCTECPLATRCVALADGCVDRLPVKAGRTQVRERHFNFLHIEDAGGIFMERRNGQDIWKGLYQLPLLETARAAGRAGLLSALRTNVPGPWTGASKRMEAVHLLTHQRIHLVFWHLQAPSGVEPPSNWFEVGLEKVGELAVPKPIERYLAEVVKPVRGRRR